MNIKKNQIPFDKKKKRYDSPMSVQINALRNIGAVFKTAEILVQENGLLGLAFLPFCHIEYVKEEYKQYVKYSQFRNVVPSGTRLPKGAIVIRELEEGELESEILGKAGDGSGNWVVDYHSHKSDASTSGRWPIEGKIIPQSAHLTQEEAVKEAKRLFTGK